MADTGARTQPTQLATQVPRTHCDEAQTVAAQSSQPHVPAPRRGRPPARPGQLHWRNNRLRRDHITAYDTGHRYTITTILRRPLEPDAQDTDPEPRDDAQTETGWRLTIHPSDPPLRSTTAPNQELAPPPGTDQFAPCLLTSVHDTLQAAKQAADQHHQSHLSTTATTTQDAARHGPAPEPDETH